jgi:hypothetical protein
VQNARGIDIALIAIPDGAERQAHGKQDYARRITVVLDHAVLISDA